MILSSQKGNVQLRTKQFSSQSHYVSWHTTFKIISLLLNSVGLMNTGGQKFEYWSFLMFVKEVSLMLKKHFSWLLITALHLFHSTGVKVIIKIVLKSQHNVLVHLTTSECSLDVCVSTNTNILSSSEEIPVQTLYKNIRGSWESFTWVSNYI